MINYRVDIKGIRQQLQINKGKSHSQSNQKSNRKKRQPSGLSSVSKQLPNTARQNNKEGKASQLSHSKNKISPLKPTKAKQESHILLLPKINKKLQDSPTKDKNINQTVLLKAQRKVSLQKNQTAPESSKKNEGSLKQQQKDIGLFLYFPQYENVVIEQVDSLGIFDEKMLDMINNDTDISYVLNALPELKDSKKNQGFQTKQFTLGKLSRIYENFEKMKVENVSNLLAKVPSYYNGNCGKNIQIVKVCLETKFKIKIDIGFLQYSVDGDKLTIFRVYMSRIYRKMNYTAFVYLKLLRLILQKEKRIDRCSIFILERNTLVHKFFKHLGFHIQKILTESKNRTVDYYQQFSIKRNELETALSAFN